MRTFADVLPLPLSTLQNLALKAPAEDDQKEEGKDKGQAKKSSPRRSQKADLGPLDVAKYLTHYNIDYSLKESAGLRLYRLKACLFDPNHKKNKAAIVQDSSGKLTYQCFHASCHGQTWAEARKQISGDANLAQFCEGYDPSRAGGAPRHSPYDSGGAEDVQPENVPAPGAAAPEDFFDGRAFMPLWLARYLEGYFKPVVYDGNEFYNYRHDRGVWAPLAEESIAQVSIQVLDSEAKSARIADATKLLSGKRFKPADELLHDSRFVNVKNGMIDTETLEVMEHDPKYHSRIQLPVEYAPGARCERWLQFLGEVFSMDLERIVCLQTYFGYCLLPDCRFQRCLFLVGSGANGKSVAVDTLVQVLGPNNVCSLPLQLFGERFLIGQLKDKLVNVATEISTSRPVDTANFKDAVAGGLLMADAKHGKPFTFYPVAKHIFSMNESPKIVDKTFGFTRRPLVIRFNERFEGPRRDTKLLSKLLIEKNGIFNWMLAGLKYVLENKDLYLPESVLQETERFIRATNPVLLFVEEECVINEKATAKPKELYQEYKNWCEEGNNRPVSRNRFYDMILMQYPSVELKRPKPGDRPGDRPRLWYGIGRNIERSD